LANGIAVLGASNLHGVPEQLKIKNAKLKKDVGRCAGRDLALT
jgi:hypothetical protein